MTRAARSGSDPPLLTRPAIQDRVRQRRRAARRQEIAAFAAECAGTPLDLDAELAAVAAEDLLGLERQARKTD